MDGRTLFADIDALLDKGDGSGGVALREGLTEQEAKRVQADPALAARLEKAFGLLESYKSAPRWFGKRASKAPGEIAYFCAEFGVDTSLPIYSGGLGVLAGDHVKEASDMGLPFVAVGLYYPEGYFQQRINAFGEQVADFPHMNASKRPLERVARPDGSPLIVSVDVGGRTISACAWKALVGNVQMYLLDADIPENDEIDRRLTARLYCADRTMRLEQEMLLGVGGWRLLQELGHDVRALHLNEGHCVFAALEWARQTMAAEGIDCAKAMAALKPHILFTTHTPVPAGNEAFDPKLVATHLRELIDALGMTPEAFLKLGAGGPKEVSGFCLSIVALALSGAANGVSRLHGEVSRKMWKKLYPKLKQNDVPIGYVTNGVHYPTWVARELRAANREAFGADIEEHLDDGARWDASRIDDAKLWSIHTQLKKRLIDELRRRRRQWLMREGAPRAVIEQVDGFLDPNALTIGFARRFTGYKRATLVFRDLKRLARILGNARCPVQIIMAGKSHPADREGQKFIARVNEIAQKKAFAGRVYLVEGYDMDLASYLVQGVDVWLNNPIKPLEASGTSGQKAAINGVLNLSVLDGWWDEGCEPSHGWGIEERAKDSEKDVAERIYTLLEKEVAPLYSERDADDVPRGWTQQMKQAIVSLSPEFTTRRMLKEYFERYYEKALTS